MINEKIDEKSPIYEKNSYQCEKNLIIHGDIYQQLIIATCRV